MNDVKVMQRSEFEAEFWKITSLFVEKWRGFEVSKVGFSYTM